MNGNEVDERALRLAQELAAGAVSCAEAELILPALEGVSPRCAKLAHFLYHYVADEDVRRRDTEYAKSQLDRLNLLIAAAYR